MPRRKCGYPRTVQNICRSGTVSQKTCCQIYICTSQIGIRRSPIILRHCLLTRKILCNSCESSRVKTGSKHLFSRAGCPYQSAHLTYATFLPVSFRGHHSFPALQARAGIAHRLETTVARETFEHILHRFGRAGGLCIAETSMTLSIPWGKPPLAGLSSANLWLTI